jgi:hypothetical protein
VSGPGTCALCCRRAGQLHFSHAAGGVCCERCHCNAAPPASREVLNYRPAKPPPRPRPTAYARLVKRAYAALGRVGDVYSLGGGRVADTARCAARARC